MEGVNCLPNCCRSCLVYPSLIVNSHRSPSRRFSSHRRCGIDAVLSLVCVSLIVSNHRPPSPVVCSIQDPQSQNQRAEDLLGKLEEFVDNDQELCREQSADGLGSHFYLVPSRWPFAIDIQRVFRTVSLHPQPRVVYDYRGKMTHVSSKLYAVDTNPFFWKSAQSTLSFSKFLTHTHKAKISGQRICWINWRNLWTMTRNYVVNNLRIALGSQFYLVPSRWPFTISFSSFSLL
ncbi:uncharacterized protein LOC130998852 isoform X1 [Salvia miltiorrhiza]|uniref:uncharacterized protein LOC130998852 isoform X1 n=1 Tax=Salvia miltiorrhiza TaxID=226208 RepID=UPI0025AB71FB|nr:uncharacterized protein LOC130998852 isoform X1 [Salvia miltiorrhiza]